MSTISTAQSSTQTRSNGHSTARTMAAQSAADSLMSSLRRVERSSLEQELARRQRIDSRLALARLANAAGDDPARDKALGEVQGLIKEGNGDGLRHDA